MNEHWGSLCISWLIADGILHENTILPLIMWSVGVRFTLSAFAVSEILERSETSTPHYVKQRHFPPENVIGLDIIWPILSETGQLALLPTRTAGRDSLIPLSRLPQPSWRKFVYIGRPFRITTVSTHATFYSASNFRNFTFYDNETVGPVTRDGVVFLEISCRLWLSSCIEGQVYKISSRLE